MSSELEQIVDSAQSRSDRLDPVDYARRVFGFEADARQGEVLAARASRLISEPGEIGRAHV